VASNVCKIIAISGIIAGDMFFCLRTIFVYLSFCMRLSVLKWHKKTQRNGEKNRRNGEKNQEPKMWKLKCRKKLETAKI
jgi:hypothetical protein